MPTHEVDVSMPTRELGSDVVFNVKVDDARLGALHVSRGAVVWFPSGNTYGFKVDWTTFGQLMVANGVGADPLTKRYLAGETVRIGLKSGIIARCLG